MTAAARFGIDPARFCCAALCGLALISGPAASAQSAAAPGPAATTLPQIGRTRARSLCTTMGDTIAPAVRGLAKSDELIGAGRRAFLKTGDDQRTGWRAAVDLDQVYLRRTADAMAHTSG